MGQVVTIIGARGRQGLAQIRQLGKAGHIPRAVSRQAESFDAEASGAVQTVAADLDDAQSLRRACEGADAVFFNRPLVASANPVERARRLGEAAMAAGVRRLVFNTACYVSEEPCGDQATDTARAMEDALAETGVALTSFRPVLFMDNLLTNWARPFIVGEGRYVYPHNPHLGANWISLDDVARFMIAALDRPDLEGERFVIGGPERLAPPEVAQILGEVLGKPVLYDPSTPEGFGRQLVDAFGEEMPPHLRAPMIKHIAEFYHFNNESPLRPFEVDMGPVLARIPLRLETLREWAARQDWSDGDGRRPPAG